MEIENRNKIAKAIIILVILAFFELQIFYLFRLVKNISVMPVTKNQTAGQAVKKNEEPKNLGTIKDSKNAFGLVEKIEDGFIFLKAGDKTVKAQITESTKIAKFQMTAAGERIETPISQNDIKAGDLVVVKAVDVITGSEFVAGEVFINGKAE